MPLQKHLYGKGMYANYERSEVSLKGKNLPVIYWIHWTSLRLLCYSWIRWDLPASFCVVFDFWSCVEENLSMNEVRQIHTSHVHVPSDKQIQVYILPVSEFNVLSLQVPCFLYVVGDSSCVSRYDSCPTTCLCVIGYQWKRNSIYIWVQLWEDVFSLRYVIMPE